jgi:hypothetical protein
MLGLAKGMTLKSLLAMPQAKQAGVTEDRVVKVLAEINARKQSMFCLNKNIRMKNYRVPQNLLYLKYEF